MNQSLLTKDISFKDIFQVIRELNREGSLTGKANHETALDIAFYVKTIVQTTSVTYKSIKSLVLTSIKLGTFSLSK